MPPSHIHHTQQALANDVKTLKSRCIEAINIIENSPPESEVTPENVIEKALCYVEGLKTEILNGDTPIATDELLLTSLFLSDMRERTAEVEELVAFTRAAIHDATAEINRINLQIKISQEARSRPRAVRHQVLPEHLQEAREKFKQMKAELHGLISSMFPNNIDAVKDVLGQLMAAKLVEGSLGYITMTNENFCVIDILKERGIIVTNPYNDMEVKLPF